MALTPDQTAAVDELAQKWLIAEQIAPYESVRWFGEEARTLHLDDVSGIPFLDGVPGMEEYQHRARVRCGDGDFFAAVTPPAEGYERYCREVLGMGSPTFLLAEPVGSVIEVAAACSHGQTFTALKSALYSEGALHIHPYMGIEAAWDLAIKLRSGSGHKVRVIAPPPAVTWVANDKGLLTQLIDAVLGENVRVAGQQGRQPHQIAEALVELAQRHGRVGLKRSRCASAMGNRVFDSQSIRSLDASSVTLLVEQFASETEWDGQEDLIACAWLDAVASPSTQLWIPPTGQGAPRVEGVYEQLLEGDEGVFLGSRPSTLPSAVNAAISTCSIQLASALQHLGYVGRCSFDLLVTGDLEGEFTVVFSECNGRWGGTSTPMALVDRLVPGPRPVYRAQDVLYSELVGRSLPSILEAISEHLYRPGVGGRYIVYNVGPLAGSGKLDVVALAPTADIADQALLVDLPLALGLRKTV